MLQLATVLGIEAVKESKCFKKAIILGYARQVDHDIRPYKLVMNFTNRSSFILRSETSMNPSKYISVIKYLLENPELITSDFL